MIIEFLGAAHEVTGSCHYVEVGDKKFLVDCGMEQGPDIYENQEIPVQASSIDYVFVTHAHIDHSGLLPLLYAHGFRGQIYATEATTELCNIMLKDSAHIQTFEAEWKNRKARRAGRPEITPLYTVEDAAGVMELFVPMHYHEKFQVCDEISVRFVDAGHLLGSSSIEIWLTEEGEQKKIVFSGDIGQGNKPLIKAPEYIEEADYVLVESTYGDRVHEVPIDFAKALADVMRQTFQAGGNLVIPAFSVGRTQEILYFIRRIKEEGMLSDIEDFEVYMDSPLAVEATAVFHSNVAECFSEEAKEIIASGKNPIRFPGLKMAVTSDESKMINFDMKPKVIISASGMCEAGRIRHHLKHNLWRPECTILFVGYQVPGTLGFHLLNGAKEVKLFGETVHVEARIENLPGISGHADRNQLLAWIGKYTSAPEKIFVVHGEDAVCDSFARAIHEQYGYDAIAPYSGDRFDLVTGMCIEEGNRKLIQKKKESSKASTNVFARLLAAGERLLRVIHGCEGMPNKELAKFADQINALSDKWSK